VSEFKQSALEQLTDQQVRFTPVARRREQMVRAEKLLGEVEPNRQYPYQFVCFRITEFRPDAYPDLLIRGADLKHDLELFLDRVARSLQTVPLEESAEPVLTLAEATRQGPVLSLEEISRRLNVSTKTVRRWRKLGLVGRQVLLNGRRHLCFPEALVEQFVASHRQSVERGARFSHLTDTERGEILRRARRLAEAGGSLTEVSRRIAGRLHRSVEAVRYTIKNHDREHPAEAVFPAATGALDGAAKQTIYHSYRRGISVNTLAKRFGRTRASMYRVINEVRAERLLNQPLDYIYHASFDDPTQEADILAPMPDREGFESKRRTMKAPKDVPAELAHLYDFPLLTKEQEQHQFRLMNFLKHKLHRLRERLRDEPAKARAQDFNEVEDLQERVAAVKDTLINCNMRLVVSIAKKHSGQTDNLWELISDGNMSLIRAVEKFDYSRGNKFSTYASWAIMKNFARSIPGERNHRERYLTGHDELFQAKADTRSDEHEVLDTAEQASKTVNRLLDQLDPRERDIIRLRAGMDGAEGLTLEQIGQQKGITKERVRQLHVRAMKKLRDLATAERVDLS
jgi:RNA polymerase sigma factor (sigma-70 family)